MTRGDVAIIVLSLIVLSSIVALVVVEIMDRRREERE